MLSLNQTVSLESSGSDSSAEDASDLEFKGAVGGQTPVTSKERRGTSNILTSTVLSSLDRAKISNRKAMQIIAPVIEAIGQDINEYSINRSSIR